MLTSSLSSSESFPSQTPVSIPDFHSSHYKEGNTLTTIPVDMEIAEEYSAEVLKHANMLPVSSSVIVDLAQQNRFFIFRMGDSLRGFQVKENGVYCEIGTLLAKGVLPEIIAEFQNQTRDAFAKLAITSHSTLATRFADVSNGDIIEFHDLSYLQNLKDEEGCGGGFELEERSLQKKYAVVF